MPLQERQQHAVLAEDKVGTAGRWTLGYDLRRCSGGGTYSRQKLLLPKGSTYRLTAPLPCRQPACLGQRIIGRGNQDGCVGGAGRRQGLPDMLPAAADRHLGQSCAHAQQRGAHTARAHDYQG